MAREAEAFAAMQKHVQHSKPPECIPLLEDTMVCHFRVNHGQVFLGHALPLLERMAKPTDIAIVNFAHWHGSARSPCTCAQIRFMLSRDLDAPHKEVMECHLLCGSQYHTLLLLHRHWGWLRV